ncbi:MAG: hypothetical protein ACOYMA_05570 [Bacteroidia bacterium]
MSETVRIRRSRLLNLKLVSFLYLIFIVLFFFSTSGNYLKFFGPFANSQNELNERLKIKLTKFKVNDSKKIAFKANSLLALEEISVLKIILNNYFSKKKIKDENLKDSKFSSKVLTDSKNLENLQLFLENFVSYFEGEKKEKLEVEFGLKAPNKKGHKKIFQTYFFNAPNGFIESLLNHYESVILYNTFDYLKIKDQNINITIKAAKKDPSLIKSLKKTYYLKENVVFDFYTSKIIKPEVIINNVTYKVKKVSNFHYVLNWKAQQEGKYILSARVKDETATLVFDVVNSDMRFFEDENDIICFVDQETTLSPDFTSLENVPDLNFFSKSASVKLNNNVLKITPTNEGFFTLELRSGSTVLSRKQMFAQRIDLPKIVLKDMAGQISTFANVHCLESVNPNWQVVNFNFTVALPNGKMETIKSNTRFLRNELRDIETNLPLGSTLIFDKIRLLNKDGISTIMGSPIFISK